jgi:uncharacterized protein (TIGR01777 family)
MEGGGAALRVLVTGGSGFIGKKLVRALRERGDTVVVTSRDVASAERALRADLEAHVRVAMWSGERAEDIASEIEQADAVVHLAGASVADKRWTPERLALLESSRTIPTTALANAIASATKKPKVLVSGSAVGYYGMRSDDVVLDESTPPPPKGADVLADICVAWEKATERARDAGVRVAIARIGIVLGTEGGALAKMLGPFKWFVGGPIGSGKQWLSWVHWRDVVGALLFAIETPALDGPFNTCAPEAATMGDFAHALGHALGRPSILSVPGFALKAALGDGMARVVLTGQRARPAKLLQAGYAFRFPSLAGALEDLVGKRR